MQFHHTNATHTNGPLKILRFYDAEQRVLEEHTFNRDWQTIHWIEWDEDPIRELRRCEDPVVELRVADIEAIITTLQQLINKGACM